MVFNTLSIQKEINVQSRWWCESWENASHFYFGEGYEIYLKFFLNIAPSVGICKAVLQKKLKFTFLFLSKTLSFRTSGSDLGSIIMKIRVSGSYRAPEAEKWQNDTLYCEVEIV